MGGEGPTQMLEPEPPVTLLRYYSYTESLRKSGPERLDDRRYMITQSLFRQIKDPEQTPYIICYLLLKCLIVRWFCGLHIHIKFHWPNLHVMEGTLYNIALPISFSSAA